MSTAASQSPDQREHQARLAPTAFTVRLPGPIDIPTSLELFRRSGDDLIDRWDGATLVRTIRVGERTVAYAGTVAGTVEAPLLSVTVDDGAHQPAVAQALQATFVPAPPAFAALLRVDPVLADLNERYPGFRPVRQFNLLAALVRCISAQQVNLRWAVTTRRRLAEAFGQPHVVAGHTVYSLSAERLAVADPAALRALQFTTRKAEYIVGVAEAIAGGRLDLDRLATLPDAEVIAQLVAVRGLGLWSAEWILARTLGRPRVVAGDLGVRKAVGLAYLGHALPSEIAVRQATAHWGEAAGVAQALLLHGFSAGAATA